MLPETFEAKIIGPIKWPPKRLFKLLQLENDGTETIIYSSDGTKDISQRNTSGQR
jgi:hypothetical protein